MKITWKSLIFCFCIFPKFIFSYEVQPWFGNVYEFEAKGSWDYLSSSRINTKHKTQKKHLWGYVFKENLLFSTQTPLSFEIELSEAKTSQHNFGIESAKASVRYKMLNDLTDDPISLTTGAALILSPGRFTKDPSLVIHKNLGCEAHISVGKEFGITEKRYFNTWATLLFGAAKSASSWTRGELHLGYVYSEKHTVDLFLDGEKGFGSKKLKSISHFPGYANLDYNFLDIGLSYIYKKNPDFSIIAKITKRVHGRFCPTNTSTVSLGIDIPFGI